jgi:hypothetical protein
LARKDIFYSGSVLALQVYKSHILTYANNYEKYKTAIIVQHILKYKVFRYYNYSGTLYMHFSKMKESIEVFSKLFLEINIFKTYLSIAKKMIHIQSDPCDILYRQERRRLRTVWRLANLR